MPWLKASNSRGNRPIVRENRSVERQSLASRDWPDLAEGSQNLPPRKFAKSLIFVRVAGIRESQVVLTMFSGFPTLPTTLDLAHHPRFCASNEHSGLLECSYL